MPYQWTAERERLMLLLAVSSSNLKPSTDTWTAVASLLGEGLTASAVSQKYYKLRKDSVKLYDGIPFPTPPTTPAKRKASIKDDEELKHQTPTKRTKKSVKKEEALKVESSSDYNDLYDYSTCPRAYGRIPFSTHERDSLPMEKEKANSSSVGGETN